MDGIIIVNKPKGWTSFDVVARIRSVTGSRRVGHSGTLDPMATGVLPIFLGKATKSIQYFLNGDKGYNGDMVLGVRTDTGDAEGQIQTTNDKLQNKSQLSISKSQIEDIMKNYTGEIQQVPPMYSAIKVKGKKLYELARQGIEVKREPRKLTIYELRITNYESPRVSFSTICSKGTYIRQLVMDIGDDLGCGAHLTRLERFYAHPFHLSQALDLGTIVTMAKAGILASVVFSPEEILDSLEPAKNG
jgi:tRNA pseudouridine55 synthase